MKLAKTLQIIGLVSPLFLLSACIITPDPYYYWGDYEQIIHDIYVVPGNADPVKQIEKLTTDIQQAQTLNKPVPPGVHAHLGFIYAIQGNLFQSLTVFEQEKALYPESAIFIDGMIERALQVGESTVEK